MTKTRDQNPMERIFPARENLLTEEENGKEIRENEDLQACKSRSVRLITRDIFYGNNHHKRSQNLVGLPDEIDNKRKLTK